MRRFRGAAGVPPIPILERISAVVLIFPPTLFCMLPCAREASREQAGSEHPPALTSQCGGKQEVGPILFDEAVSDLLGAGPASQQTDIADEFRGQGKWQAEEVFPL